MNKKYIVLSLLFSAVPGMCFGWSAHYTALMRQKQEKLEQLEKCQGKTTNLKIAGISTLGLTAVGVAGNIAEAKIISDNKSKIEKLDDKIDKQKADIERQKWENEQERLRQEEERRLAAERERKIGTDCTSFAKADTTNPNAAYVVNAVWGPGGQCLIQDCDKQAGFKVSSDAKKCEAINPNNGNGNSNGGTTPVVTIPDGATACDDATLANAKAEIGYMEGTTCKILKCKGQLQLNSNTCACPQGTTEDANFNCVAPVAPVEPVTPTPCEQSVLDNLKAQTGHMEANVCKIDTCKGQLEKKDNNTCECPAATPVMNSDFTCSANAAPDGDNGGNNNGNNGGNNGNNGGNNGNNGGNNGTTPVVTTKCTAEFLRTHNAATGKDCEDTCCITKCKANYVRMLWSQIIPDSDKRLDPDMVCEKDTREFIQPGDPCQQEDLAKIHATAGVYERGTNGKLVCKPTKCDTAHSYFLKNGKCEKPEVGDACPDTDLPANASAGTYQVTASGELRCFATQCINASIHDLDRRDGRCYSDNRSRFNARCHNAGGETFANGSYTGCKKHSMTREECEGFITNLQYAVKISSFVSGDKVSGGDRNKMYCLPNF